jgi:hypothetical protein
MSDPEITASSKSVSLVDLARFLAGPDQKYNYFHGKIYSFIPPSTEMVNKFLGELKFIADAAPNRHPASILVGDFSTLIKQEAIQVLAAPNGHFTIFNEVRDRKLPTCLYFAIIAPAHRADGTTSYAEACHTINFIRSFLTLYFGKLLFYDWVADFDFDLEGKLSFSGGFVRLPLYADLFKIVHPTLANAIIDRLSKQQSPFREQFQTACNFLSNALNQKDEAFRFSSYWIALEVISRGRSAAIRSRLAHAYGKPEKFFVDEGLRFSEISKIRHYLLHKGQFKTLKSYQERLLQLYFWDIVLDEINLPPGGLSYALVQSGVIEQEVRETTPAPESNKDAQ